MDWAGGRTGTNYAAQGNILVSGETVDALAETFEASCGQAARRPPDRLPRRGPGSRRRQPRPAVVGAPRRPAGRRLRGHVGRRRRAPRRGPRAPDRGAAPDLHAPRRDLREDATPTCGSTGRRRRWPPSCARRLATLGYDGELEDSFTRWTGKENLEDRARRPRADRPGRPGGVAGAEHDREGVRSRASRRARPLPGGRRGAPLAPGAPAARHHRLRHERATRPSRARSASSRSTTSRTATRSSTSSRAAARRSSSATRRSTLRPARSSMRSRARSAAPSRPSRTRPCSRSAAKPGVPARDLQMGGDLRRLRPLPERRRGQGARAFDRIRRRERRPVAEALQPRLPRGPDEEPRRARSSTSGARSSSTRPAKEYAANDSDFDWLRDDPEFPA